MRYFLIFGITIIIALFIMFYNPYLGVYKDQITIEYSFSEDGYYWKYDISNDNLHLKESSDNKWIFIPNKNGIVTLNYYYTNGEENLYEIFYEFKVKNHKIYWVKGEGTGLLSYPNPY